MQERIFCFKIHMGYGGEEWGKIKKYYMMLEVKK